MKATNAPNDKYRLRLYVAGETPGALHSAAFLREICESELEGRYELEVVDVLEHPDAAVQDKVFATPTLVKESPPPPRRIIGDLTETNKVLQGLDLPPAE